MPQSVVISPARANPAGAVDLASLPFKPSRLLTDWRATREQQRRMAQAEAESARVMASMRRPGSVRPQRQPTAGAATAGLPAFKMVSGARAFGAGGTDRLTGAWGAINTGINADLEASLATLRARSRDWAVNTDQGARYLELCADNIVGAYAPTLQVRAKLRDGSDVLDEVANTAIEQAWAAWCARGVCELTGQLSFTDVCRAIVQATARDGEYLAKRIRSRSLPYGYALQLLEVDRIDSSLNTVVGNTGNTIRMGVELDTLGRRQALHLLNRHPGDAGGGLSAGASPERVVVNNLLHGFVLKRPEQLRGYPWAAAVLRRANTLSTYEGYALEAAKFGAAKMGFYTIDKDAVNGAELTWEQMRDATGELVQDVEGGMLEALPPGVGFEGFDPAYPAEAFSSFVTEYKRDIAAGLGVAHHNLSGNMTGVNYSSARIAELSERRAWRSLQRWLIDSFVRPVFEDWLTAALITKQIVLPSGASLPADRAAKFLAAATFQPPGWAWVDPEKDIKAAVLAMSYDVRSLRAFANEQGVDVEDTLADKAALLARYKALGLPVPGWLSGAAAVGSQGVTPASGAAPAAETPGADQAADEGTP